MASIKKRLKKIEAARFRRRAELHLRAGTWASTLADVAHAAQKKGLYGLSARLYGIAARCVDEKDWTLNRALASTLDELSDLIEAQK